MSAGDAALERVMKLEIAILLLVNTLRNNAFVSTQMLDTIEKIVTSGGAQSG
jgi:hypothetical protein